MKVVVVIQARTNSSRLPGKVLLPLGGLPIAVLAAKRADCHNKTVIVATSIENTDDYLSDILKQHDVNVFRGDLDNVLKRYCDCLAEYSDSTIIVRLTADNVFPDSTLIDELVDEFVKITDEYLCLNGELSGLPYGVSAEVMRLRVIREALFECTSKFDLEHVTPYIRRKYGAVYFKKYLSLNLGIHRCTIDSFSDYIDVVNVFNGLVSPEKVPLTQLMKILEVNNPLIKNENKALILGTAQLGLEYGITNKTGKPSKRSSFSLLSHAVKNGVQYIDTANAYGDSESIIGEWLATGWRDRVSVITKLSVLSSLDAEKTVQEVQNEVDLSLQQSLINLKLNKIDVLMLHRAEHLFSYNGTIFSRLIEWKRKDKISSLGVSIQSPEELVLALSYPEVEFIQMPFNILDNRWYSAINQLKEARKTRKINVHVRSVYLQGLLLSDSVALWNRANVDNPSNIITWLAETTASLGYENTAATCINFVISHDWVDAIVLGVDSEAHLNEGFSYIREKQIPEEMLIRIDTSRPAVSEKTLNPALWKNK